MTFTEAVMHKKCDLDIAKLLDTKVYYLTEHAQTQHAISPHMIAKQCYYECVYEQLKKFASI